MDIHKHARLTLRRRQALVRTVLIRKVTLNAAGAEFKVGARTSATWVCR